MHSSFPIVSIVIPTYNREQFLSRALISVVSQSFTSWEAIVVDNYSEDNTEQVIEDFGDSRIKLLKIHNRGIIAASRNIGIKTSKGKWIAFLDSDDFRKLDVFFQHHLALGITPGSFGIIPVFKTPTL